MKLVAPVRLLADAAQSALLRETLERCNAACTWIAEAASKKCIRRQYDIHHAVYAETRTDTVRIDRPSCRALHLEGR